MLNKEYYFCYNFSMEKIKLEENAILFQNKLFSDNGDLLNPINTQNYQIIQLADSFYLSEFNIDKHLQFCDIEITLVVYNKMQISTNKVFEEVKQEEVYLSFKNDIHALKSKEKCRFITLAFNVNKNSPCNNLYKRLLENNYDLKARKIVCKSIIDSLYKIVNEFHNPQKEFKEIYLDSLVTLVLSSIVKADYLPNLAVYSEQKNLVPKIFNYIDTHFLEIKRISNIAKALGYSENYIYKLFKSNSKQSLKEYLTQKKMQHAKALLKEHVKVVDIAEKLGYSNAGNFSRAFYNFFKRYPTK